MQWQETSTFLLHGKKTDFGFENAELGFLPASDPQVKPGAHRGPSKINERFLHWIVPTPEQGVGLGRRGLWAGEGRLGNSHEVNEWEGFWKMTASKICRDAAGAWSQVNHDLPSEPRLPTATALIRAPRMLCFCPSAGCFITGRGVGVPGLCHTITEAWLVQYLRVSRFQSARETHWSSGLESSS